jgi:hypothetical protein
MKTSRVYFAGAPWIVIRRFRHREKHEEQFFRWLIQGERSARSEIVNKSMLEGQIFRESSNEISMSICQWRQKFRCSKRKRRKKTLSRPTESKNQFVLFFFFDASKIRLSFELGQFLHWTLSDVAAGSSWEGEFSDTLAGDLGYWVVSGGWLRFKHLGFVISTFVIMVNGEQLNGVSASQVGLEYLDFTTRITIE